MDRAALSPGWQTHLMFAGLDGDVIEPGNHLVERTPSSPGCYWGKFLLDERLPSEADFGPWMQRFDEAIGICRQLGFGQHDTLWMPERRAPEDVAAL